MPRAAFALMAVLSWARFGGADPIAPEADVSTYIRANGSCPSAAGTWQALTRLVSDEELERAQSLLSVPWATVEDSGESYAVDVDGGRRVYPGPDRNCAERAKISAVFIALRLNVGQPSTDAAPSDAADPKGEDLPTSSVAESPATPVPSANDSSSTPNPSPAGEASPGASGASLSDGSTPSREFDVHDGAELWRSLELAATASVALEGKGAYPLSAGLAATGALGWGSVGASFGAGITVPSLLRFSTTNVEATRIPLELTLALRALSGNWRFVGNLGAAVDLWRFEGTADEAKAQWRGLFGGVTRISLRYFGWGPVGPAFSLFASAFPKRHRFVVAPVGSAGKTNRFWIGASAGAVWDSP